MKLAEMIEIRDNRKNRTNFLSLSDKTKLQNILKIQVAKYSYVELCNLVIDKYMTKKFSNDKAKRCFEILAQANINFKIERYRYDSDYKILYKYSKEHDSYLFYLADCGFQTYNTIIKRDGKYID